jgi:organic radical activating enzyme
MQHPPTAESARISEIFSSIQGEGTHLGERHLFVRFEECNIHCEYCDELEKIGTPMSLESAVEEVKRLEREEGPHTFVSLTGGEPLLYLSFLRPLMALLKKENLRIYLETSGILWRALGEVIDLCDCIAMDVKPASVTKERNFDEEHRRFLEAIRQNRKEAFIKIVLSKEIDPAEFESQIRLIAEIAPQIPVLLQPVSSRIEGHEDSALMNLLYELQQSASRIVRDVRIVPRFHKIFNLR